MTDQTTKGRHKAFLRNVSGDNVDGYHMINIPHHIWKEMGWKINDKLIIDTVKMGIEENIIIKKEIQ